ncbi:MAG: VWA domain-containing protein [Ruminococcus sp.]|nr:VWA domain-containing protein [Ruminococcus sp.]
MKKIARLLLLLSLVFCVFLSLPMSVSAASVDTQDGLEVTITTDKTEYTANQDIKVSVIIKNNNSYKVEDISVETLLPEGFVLKSGNLSEKDIDVEAGEAYTADVVVQLFEKITRPAETIMISNNEIIRPSETIKFVSNQDISFPRTGDSSVVEIWAAVVFISAIGLVLAVKFKKTTKTMSLFFCLVLIITVLPIGTLAVAAEYDVTVVTVDNTITVDAKEYVIKADVAFATEQGNNPNAKVTFDLNYENAVNNIPAQTVSKGTSAVEPVAPEREGYFFVGWYLNKNDTDYNNYFDFETPVNANTTLYAVWVSQTDTDLDNLADDLEAAYGTDKTNKDTDGDGLSDYLEIFGFKTNPLLKDTDGNGVNDGDEDFDGDKLTNSVEVSIGTKPLGSDSDDDGLSDGDEKKVYGTDPLKKDTDGDGVSDSKEVELGTDPLVVQDTFEISLSADNKGDKVKASVNIELSGEQVETLKVEAFENENLFPETMPGYMGKAYDFSVDGTFSTATISFEFDAAVNKKGVDPVIYYFNEKTQDLEELKTTINGNVASTTVTHFSKYILVDRKVYQDSFTWIDSWDSTQTFTEVEIVFVIDDSGSMDWNDPKYERLNVARTLVDNLPKNSKIGIVRFDGDLPKTEALTKTLTTDKEKVKKYLTRDYFYSPGGTDMYNGINKAFPLYESSKDTTLKMMIVLSDGETDDTNLHDSVVATANDKDVRVYTVGLGKSSSSYFNRYLKPLAVNTGASFYLASDATQLADIYKEITEKIDIETDSDGDNIPDYYEDNMICFNGVKLALDKNKPDTDGDGLKDGEEVKLDFDYSDDGKKVKVTGKLVSGNPVKKDSDNDGYADNVDLNPLVAYKTPIILLHGLSDNTVCFGVSTQITKAMNTDYGSEYTKEDSNGKKYLYTDCTSHRIKSVGNGYLGGYLKDALSYSENKNLFAFNYPNHDMVQFNGARLDGYIADLIATAQDGSAKNVADAQYIFATKDDKAKGNVKFILIGHSMGGLVSRYYVENIGTTNVEKVITIDTPHYGSGLANTSDILGDSILFSPSNFDLRTDSTLFGGDVRWWDFTLGGVFRADSEYALENQSPALNGNKNTSVKYYAVGGYSVGRGWIGGELDQLAEPLRDTVFAFEFNRSVRGKDGYKSSINDALKDYSLKKYNASSELDLGDSNGDDTVDYMSQFAVRFDGKEIDYQVLERTALVVNAKSGAWLANPFHNIIQGESTMHEYVGAFVND